MTIDRIKEIQLETAYPESVSVQQALLKVWNECDQETKQLKEENESLSMIIDEREEWLSNKQKECDELTKELEALKTKHREDVINAYNEKFIQISQKWLDDGGV